MASSRPEAGADGAPSASHIDPSGARFDTVWLDLKEAPVKGKRSYHSALRQEQARQTRRRMVEAARALFVDQGYRAATVAAVARRAEVSVDTVYSTFGSKGELLKAVLDVVIGGDDQNVPLLERPGPQALRDEPDQRRQVAMFAAGMSEQLERLRPMEDILRSAAAVDADAAALRADIQLRQRRDAMRTVIGWIAARGPLRDDLTDEDAAAVTWTLTSPEVHVMLRDACGWPPERYTRWLRTP